jgi:hypothetical protein
MVVAVTIIFFVCELFPAISLIVVRGKDAITECSVACAKFVSIADTMVCFCLRRCICQNHYYHSIIIFIIIVVVNFIVRSSSSLSSSSS